MLDEAAGSAETAISLDGKRGDAAAVVIRNQNECASFVEGDVARSRAARGHLIQKLERAGFRINGKRTDRATGSSVEIADFIHGVEILAVGMNGQK